VRFTAGQLQPTFAWTTNRTIYPSGNAQVSTGDFDVVWNGPVLGSGRLIKYGSGVLTIRDADEYSGNALVQEGLLVIEGSFAGGAFTNSAGSIAGNGTWDGDISGSGTVAPGPGVATLTARNVTLTTLALEILSPTEYDRLVVRGAFEIAGTAHLQLTLGYDPLDEVHSFLLVDNDGTDAIIGAEPRHFRFQGNELSEGETFFVGSQAMRISYFGGDGNDLVIFAVPEPTSLTLAIAVLPLLAARRRHRMRQAP
jgi:hypothetical protein